MLQAITSIEYIARCANADVTILFTAVDALLPLLPGVTRGCAIPTPRSAVRR
jgi:hypothetical protein